MLDKSWGTEMTLNCMSSCGTLTKKTSRVICANRAPAWNFQESNSQTSYKKTPALNLWLHPLKLMTLSVICHRELIMTLVVKGSYMGTFSSIWRLDESTLVQLNYLVSSNSSSDSLTKVLRTCSKTCGAWTTLIIDRDRMLQPQVWRSKIGSLLH